MMLNIITAGIIFILLGTFLPILLDVVEAIYVKIFGC